MNDILQTLNDKTNKIIQNVKQKEGELNEISKFWC